MDKKSYGMYKKKPTMKNALRMYSRHSRRVNPEENCSSITFTFNGEKGFIYYDTDDEENIEIIKTDPMLSSLEEEKQKILVKTMLNITDIYNSKMSTDDKIKKLEEEKEKLEIISNLLAPKDNNTDNNKEDSKTLIKK